MKPAKAVKRLDAIDPSLDPERAHAEADLILRAVVPSEVDKAYRRLVERSRWWACA
jgi:hypothetical protein